MDHKHKRLVRMFRELFPSLTEVSEAHLRMICSDDVRDWDSVGQLNLLIAVEEEFGTKIPDEVALGMDSYMAVENFVFGPDEE